MESSIFPDQFETRNQKQENWKIHKCVEIKQHTPEQPVSQKRNQK